MNALKLTIGTCLLLLSQICTGQSTQLDSILSFEVFEGEWEQTATYNYEYISPNELRINHYRFDADGNYELFSVIDKVFNANGDIIERRLGAMKTIFEYDENFNIIGEYQFFFDSENEIWLKWQGVEFKDFDEFGNYQTRNELRQHSDENEWYVSQRQQYEYIYNADDLVDSLIVFDGQDIRETKGYLYNDEGLELECIFYYSFDNNKVRNKSVKNYSSNGLLLDHTNIYHDYQNDEYYVDSKLNYSYDEDERLIMQINQDRYQDLPVFFKYDFYYKSEVVENEKILNVNWYNSQEGKVEVSIDGLNFDDDYRIQLFNMEGKVAKLLNIQNSESWTGSFRLVPGMYSLVILNDNYFIHAEKIISIR